MQKQVQCPVVVKGSEQCSGHVARVAARGDVEWRFSPDGWIFSFVPHTRFRLACSEDESHITELTFDQLPDELQRIMQL